MAATATATSSEARGNVAIWCCRQLLTVVVALVLTVHSGEGGASPSKPNRTQAAGDIIDMKVSFTVTNLNRTAARNCRGDGSSLKLSGHIIGPRSALVDGAAATLYIHGVAVPEPTWRMPLAGYDYGLEQARRGHVSVTFDRPGYAASMVAADGRSICIGVQADIAHQIVDQLRRGGYTAAAPIRFARIALAGHSLGQEIAELAAATFGDVDALVVGGFRDPSVLSPRLSKAATQYVSSCLRGGQPKTAGGPGGYAYTFAEGTDFLFHNAEDVVIDAFAAYTEADPCDVSTIVLYGVVTALQLAQIRVPVLLFYGDQDALWYKGAGRRQKALFIGSKDVTLLEYADTGHMIMLGRTAPAFRADVSGWLKAHGY